MALVKEFVNSAVSIRTRMFMYLRDKQISLLRGSELLDIYYYTFRNFMMERTTPRYTTLHKIDEFLKKNGY